MEIISTIGIFLAIIAIVWFSVKGLNIVVGAPLATLIVILTNRMDIFGSLVGTENSYMSSLAGFLISNFAIFLLGSILGQLMDRTTATVSIADGILGKTGTDNPFLVLVGIFIIGLILTYGGISMFVVLFALIPMAKPIFQRLNINWSLVTIPIFMGAGTITVGVLPGSPSIQNAIPANALGTNLTAGWQMGLAAAVVVVAFGLWYMRRQLNKSLERGETFYSYLDTGDGIPNIPEEDVAQVPESEIPNFWLSILPLVALIAIIFFFADVDNILLIALTAAILLVIVLNWNYLNDLVNPLSAGADGAVGASMATASTVGFGGVLASAPGFDAVTGAISQIPGSPIFSLAVVTAVLGGITGSASASLGIVMDNFAQGYLDLGLNPQVVHRIAAISSTVITVMPQSGVIITFNRITGMKLKDSFWHAFWIVNGGHLLGLVAAIIIALVVY